VSLPSAALWRARRESDGFPSRSWQPPLRGGEQPLRVNGGADGGQIDRAAADLAEQSVIAAAACDLSGDACALDFDLEDEARVIFDGAAEIGFKPGALSSDAKLRKAPLQGAQQLEMGSERAAERAEKLFDLAHRLRQRTLDAQIGFDQAGGGLGQRALASVRRAVLKDAHDFSRTAQADDGNALPVEMVEKLLFGCFRLGRKGKA